MTWCGELDSFYQPLSYILFAKLKSFGDWSDGGTPGNIPNPAVKAVSADGTWGATPRESRSLPKGFFYLTGYRIYAWMLVAFPNTISH